MNYYMNTFTRVEQALQAYRAGRPVLLTDDADREDECDLVAAAENITPQVMAMMIRDGSGIVCLCLEKQQIDVLGLAPMVQHNESRNQTAFTISIEAKEGVSTGVSANDRVTTIAAALSSTANNRKIVSPGHVFPLCAASGGVLIRRGHTEGSLELAKMAGLKPAAVLCELMNPDGTMARGYQIKQYALKHHLPVVSIEDIVQYHQYFYSTEHANVSAQLVA